MFYSKNFIVLVFMSRSLIHFKLIFVYSIRLWIQIHSLECGYPVFPAPPFFAKWSWNTYKKSFDLICKGLFWGSLFYFIGLYVCPFVTVLITVRKCETYNFILLKTVLALRDSLTFITNFRL